MANKKSNELIFTGGMQFDISDLMKQLQTVEGTMVKFQEKNGMITFQLNPDLKNVDDVAKVVQTFINDIMKQMKSLDDLSLDQIKTTIGQLGEALKNLQSGHEVLEYWETYDALLRRVAESAQNLKAALDTLNAGRIDFLKDDGEIDTFSEKIRKLREAFENEEPIKIKMMITSGDKTDPETVLKNIKETYDNMPLHFDPRVSSTAFAKFEEDMTKYKSYITAFNNDIKEALEQIQLLEQSLSKVTANPQEYAGQGVRARYATKNRETKISDVQIVINMNENDRALLERVNHVLKRMKSEYAKINVQFYPHIAYKEREEVKKQIDEIKKDLESLRNVRVEVGDIVDLPDVKKEDNVTRIAINDEDVTAVMGVLDQIIQKVQKINEKTVNIKRSTRDGLNNVESKLKDIQSKVEEINKTPIIVKSNLDKWTKDAAKLLLDKIILTKPINIPIGLDFTAYNLSMEKLKESLASIRANGGNSLKLTPLMDPTTVSQVQAFIDSAKNVDLRFKGQEAAEQVIKNLFDKLIELDRKASNITLEFSKNELNDTDIQIDELARSIQAINDKQFAFKVDSTEATKLVSDIDSKITQAIERERHIKISADSRTKIESYIESIRKTINRAIETKRSIQIYTQPIEDLRKLLRQTGELMDHTLESERTLKVNVSEVDSLHQYLSQTGELIKNTFEDQGIKEAQISFSEFAQTFIGMNEALRSLNDNLGKKRTTIKIGTNETSLAKVNQSLFTSIERLQKFNVELTEMTGRVVEYVNRAYQPLVNIKTVVGEIAAEIRALKDIGTVFKYVNINGATKKGEGVEDKEYNKVGKAVESLNKQIASFQRTAAYTSNSTKEIAEGMSKSAIAAHNFAKEIKDLNAEINTESIITDTRVKSYEARFNRASESLKEWNQQVINIEKVNKKIVQMLNSSDTQGFENQDPRYITNYKEIAASLRELRGIQGALQNLDKLDSKQVKVYGDRVEELTKNLRQLYKTAETVSSKSSKTFVAQVDPKNIEAAKTALESYTNSLGGVNRAITRVGSTDSKGITRLTREWTTQDGIVKTLNADYNTLTGTLNVVGIAERQAYTFADRLSTAFKRQSANLIASLGTVVSFYRIIDTFRQGVQTVTEIDSAMTELRKVSDATATQLREFEKASFDLGRQVGTTGKEIINSAADFSRLGYSLQEAGELARVASIYLNVGDSLEGIDTATDHLVSTMKAFNIQAKDSMGVIDAMNEVANNFATSAGDIGEGLKRSSAALAVAGNDLNQSIAMFTAGQEIVQNAESVGTALRTISLRLRGKFLCPSIAKAIVRVTQINKKYAA